MGYRFPPDTMKALLKSGRIIFGDDESKIIEIKVYVSEYEDKLPGVITLDGRAGPNELRALFPEGQKVFDNPKPRQLLIDLLSFVSRPDSIILDSFAGSGSTAHAVLELNKRDGGGRRFILVECEDYAEELTAERVRRAIRGVPTATDEALNSGTGGTFTYVTLGAPLDLDAILTGASLPTYDAIGAWLFHTATGEALNLSAVDQKQWFLGESRGFSVWLIYKPNLDFLKSREAALTLEVAERISATSDSKLTGKRHLVFAPARYVPNRMLLPLGVEHAPLPFALFRVEKG